MGLSYDKSPYGKTTSKLKKDPNYAWAFTFPRTAAEQAQYCVTQGWVMGGIDVTNWSNVEAGDLLFGIETDKKMEDICQFHTLQWYMDLMKKEMHLV